MNIKERKSELINWLENLKNEALINRIEELKEEYAIEQVIPYKITE